jgi:hypothetical protein
MFKKLFLNSTVTVDTQEVNDVNKKDVKVPGVINYYFSVII